MSCVFRKKSKLENPPWKLIDLLRGENWARREISKRKKPQRGRRKRKASKKTHSGSLLICCEEKTGRGRKKASGKTHDMGVRKEKQARKPRCGVRKQAKK